MTEGKAEPRWVTTTEAARIINERYKTALHPNTILNWAKKGYIPAMRMTPTSWWQVDLDATVRLFDKRVEEGTVDEAAGD